MKREVGASNWLAREWPTYCCLGSVIRRDEAPPPSTSCPLQDLLTFHYLTVKGQRPPTCASQTSKSTLRGVLVTKRRNPGVEENPTAALDPQPIDNNKSHAITNPLSQKWLRLTLGRKRRSAWNKTLRWINCGRNPSVSLRKTSRWRKMNFTASWCDG